MVMEALLPSPLGRRCPAGADEGTCEASCAQLLLGPRPRSAPRPALAARALQDTRASGAQAVPLAPQERGF
ncbi:hypothetical protein DYQ48_08875 [Xanthomonas hortorum]|nr:hypothetical protein DYQ48_08875 [Xanthomonas hortorum]